MIAQSPGRNPLLVNPMTSRGCSREEGKGEAKKKKRGGWGVPATISRDDCVSAAAAAAGGEIQR